MRVALFAYGSHRLLPDIVRLAQRLGRADVFDCGADGCENLAADTGPELVLNFLTNEIFRDFVLGLPNVFHPASPAYRGVGAASLALYNGVETFGATAHGMVRAIDAGPIFAVERFSVLPSDTSETLFAHAEMACVTLFDRITDTIARTGSLPVPCGEQWTGRYIGRAEFFRWMEIDPSNVGACGERSGQRAIPQNTAPMS